MSIFSTILSRILGHKSTAVPAATADAATPAPGLPNPNAPLTGAPAPGANSQSAPGTAAPPLASAPASSGATAATPVGTPAAQVDVPAVLAELAQQNGQGLNWRSSIVDLMKLLGLDSSLANRKELAQELGYSGNTEDSAAMNIWLHKQVMRKLAENGGKVPEDLKN